MNEPVANAGPSDSRTIAGDRGSSDDTQNLDGIEIDPQNLADFLQGMFGGSDQNDGAPGEF